MMTLYRLSGFVQRVDRQDNDGRVAPGKFLDGLLEVSQLLTAIGSLVATVDQNDCPPATEVGWKRRSPSINQRHVKGRERMPRSRLTIVRRLAAPSVPLG